MVMHPRASAEFYGKLCIAALAIITGCALHHHTPPPVTTVYLVRHGEKSTAIPNDPDPDLSSAGRARAGALAVLLRNSGVSAIVTTQLKRTRETAQPLAALMGVVPEIVPTGDSTHADSVAAVVKRHRGEKILVVGHSNTIGSIIAALGGPRLPNLCDGEYSSLFVMTFVGSGPSTLIRQHYGTLDPLPDSACLTMQSR
jgi:broad specificity phosphatase PhoE